MKSKMNFKTMKKSSKDAFITYAMVVIVYLIIQAMVMSGSMSSLMQGMLVPLLYLFYRSDRIESLCRLLRRIESGSCRIYVCRSIFQCIFHKMYGGFIHEPDRSFYHCIIDRNRVCGIFGFLIGIPVLRLRGDYLAIVTLAFGEIIKKTL